MCGIVPDGLPGDLHRDTRVRVLAGIQVPIPEREIATGHFQPDRVAFQKDIAGDLEIERVLQYRVRLNQLRVRPIPAPVPRPNDAFRDVDRAAIGINVDESSDKIRIACARRRPQFQRDRAGHLQISR